MPLQPYFSAQGAEIYHGNSMEILDQLSHANRAIDCMITDPPYGIGLGVREEKMQKHGNSGYASDFEDTEEYVRDVCVPIVEKALGMAARGVVIPGIRCCFFYPVPYTMWSLYWPNGAGLGRWSRFTCSQPVLCYGMGPPRKGSQPDTYVTTEQAEKNGHPCPKPIGVMRWLVRQATDKGELIVDPFAGSGSTLLASVQLGRRAIGIDSSESACEIAAKRLGRVSSQPAQNKTGFLF